MKIYTNSYIHSDEITPDNFVEVFESYADKLEEIAHDYRKLIKYVKTKNIKILDAHGFAHGGHFSVDEIDTARLKQEGLVVDFGDTPCVEEHPVFYIETALDDIMDESFATLDPNDPNFEEMADEIMEKIKKQINQDITDEDTPEINFDEDEDDMFPEASSHFNLGEKLANPPEGGFAPGNMLIEVSKIDDDHFTFNLTMADLGEDPAAINFLRDESVFEYECAGCEEKHLESLDSAYRSLKTASAIFSNLIEMTRDYRELSTALEFIDSDLRLLQWLLRLDYALEDDVSEKE